MRRFIAGVFVALALAVLGGASVSPDVYHDIRPQAAVPLTVDPGVYHDI